MKYNNLIKNIFKIQIKITKIGRRTQTKNDIHIG
jgi:hypothetical protein